jgi:RNA polymerase sigma factor (TIGR02999 family)
VHDFFLDLARREGHLWKNRAHFLAGASIAMRRLLVDYARGRNAQKRGAGAVHTAESLPELAFYPDFPSILELDDLLGRLEAEEPRMARVVELRCFGGLTAAEIGLVLAVDSRTVKRDWQVAKAATSDQRDDVAPDPTANWPARLTQA